MHDRHLHPLRSGLEHQHRDKPRRLCLPGLRVPGEDDSGGSDKAGRKESESPSTKIRLSSTFVAGQARGVSHIGTPGTMFD